MVMRIIGLEKDEKDLKDKEDHYNSNSTCHSLLITSSYLTLKALWFKNNDRFGDRSSVG